MSRQLWIADRCRSAGLEVAEVNGWRDRGSSAFNPAGLVAHHTAGASTGEMPSLRVLIYGRSDLPGPLCNVGLGRSGKVYVVAAGRANHAGRGGWAGMVGNSSVMGIEAENDGRQPWPQVQLAAYKKLSRALLAGMGSPARLMCAHREWAPGRKIDPHAIDMAAWRADLGAPTPAPQPQPPLSDDEFRRRIMAKPVLSEGAGVGDRAHQFWDVGIMQALMGWHGAVPVSLDDRPNGRFDFRTRESLAAWQGRTGALVADGICGPATWAFLAAV